jgi:hypothetical protein
LVGKEVVHLLAGGQSATGERIIFPRISVNGIEQTNVEGTVMAAEIARAFLKARLVMDWDETRGFRKSEREFRPKSPENTIKSTRHPRCSRALAVLTFGLTGSS